MGRSIGRSHGGRLSRKIERLALRTVHQTVGAIECYPVRFNRWRRVVGEEGGIEFIQQARFGVEIGKRADGL